MISLFSNYCANNKRNFFLYLMLFHVVCSLFLYGIAHTVILNEFHNGNGLWNATKDSIKYHEEARRSVFYLQEGLWSMWWNLYPGHEHVRIISGIYWITGYSEPIAYEVFNSFAWAASVILIYKTSLLLFTKNNKIALIAILFFFQPSILISSTQMLREPIFLLGFSLLIYCTIALLTKNSNKFKIICTLQVAIFLLILIRDYLSGFFIVFLIILSLIAIFQKKLSLLQIILMMSPLLIFENITFNTYLQEASKISLIQQEILIADYKEKEKEKSGAEELADKAEIKAGMTKEEAEIVEIARQRYEKTLLGSIDKKLSGVSRKISSVRYGFRAVNSGAGSSLDTETLFLSFGDIFNYIPRALQISFLSPFPNQWLEERVEVGVLGSILSGIEIFFWYFILLGCAYLLIKKPLIYIPMTSIFIVSFSVILLIAISIPNLGAIYRMRQPYMLPFYIYGAYGLNLIFAKLSQQK